MNTFLLRLVACLFVVVSSSSHAALYDRGNGLIYDDVLNITWMQDANYAYTSSYAGLGDYAVGGFDEAYALPNGRMNNVVANIWIEQLVYADYGDWRLPSANLMNASNPCTANDGGCDKGANVTTSELGHMFYNNLGNLGLLDANFNSISEGVPNATFTEADNNGSVSFLNLQAHLYLYEDVDDPTSSGYPTSYRSYSFNFTNGHQGSGYGTYYAWAVADGDIVTLGLTSVPIPATAWLFGSALAGLLVARRKNKK